MQDGKLPQAVFTKGLRDRNCPIYTFSQTGSGALRVKARKYVCFLTVAQSQLYMHVRRAKRRSVEVTGRAGEVLVISDAR
jgi:hypothetical protein